MSVANIAGRREADYGARTQAEQERAFGAAERHTRMVRLLRRVLPVCAVLATGLYLVTSSISFSVGPLDASVERVEVSRDSLRMVNPKLQGFDQKNGSYLVTADYADQSISATNVIRLTAIKAEMGNDEKGFSRLTAKGGEFDTKSERLLLHGDIQVSTSSGMTGRLDAAAIDMQNQMLTSDKPVEFDLINGKVKAETMELRSADKTLFFRGKVKVHIRKRPEGQPAKSAEKVVAQP